MLPANDAKGAAASKAAALLQKIWVGVTAFAGIAVICMALSETLLRLVNPGMLTDWGLEVMIYVIAWVIMITMPAVIVTGSHIQADFFRGFMSLRTRRIIYFLECVLGTVFCALTSYFGYQAAGLAYRLEQVSDTSLQFPIWIFVSAIPVGFGLSVFAYLYCTAQSIRAPEQQ